MAGIARFSEATALAMHTMALLAIEPERMMSIREIVSSLAVSENHLAKVLQRLSKAGLVESVRGPRGGFRIARDPAEITLLEVYEVIEGHLAATACMFSVPKCTGDCLLGGLLGTVNRQIREHLRGSKLSDLHWVFKKAEELS